MIVARGDRQTTFRCQMQRSHDERVYTRELRRITMTTEKSREDVYKQIVIYGAWGLVSLLFIGGGYLLEHPDVLEHPWDRTLLSHISTEIGIAVLVAIIIALTIEYQSRKSEERQREAERQLIKTDVLEHVLGYRLPEGVFAELDNQILNAWVIRKDFTASYRLSRLEDPYEGFIKISGQLSYKLFNMTSREQPFEFTTFIEKTSIEELNQQFVKFTIVKIGGGPDISAEADDTGTPNHLVIKKQIHILGSTYASVIIRFEVVRPREGGTSFILTPKLALGFNLKVEVEKELKLDVLASSYLPESLHKADDHLPQDNSYHWFLKNPLLPYQGVYLTWKSQKGESGVGDQQPATLKGEVGVGD